MFVRIGEVVDLEDISVYPLLAGRDGKNDFTCDINIASGKIYKYNNVYLAYAITALSDFFFAIAGNLAMTGQYNIGIGASALLANTSGDWNNAIGCYALIHNTEGKENQAFGGSSLYANTTGQRNVGMGDASLSLNVSGNYNSALGYGAGVNSLGSYNTFLGSMSNVADPFNFHHATAVGYGAQVGGSNMMALGGTGAEAVNVGINDPTPGERLDVNGNINATGVFKVDDIQVVGNRVIDARLDDAINSGDATTDGVIDALRDLILAHGLGAVA